MACNKITISVSEKTMELLVNLAAEKGMKKSAIIALALAELNDNENQKKGEERK